MSAEQAFWLPISNLISKQLVVQTTLVRTEAPSELPKVSMVKTSFQKLKNHLASFDKVVKVRTTLDAITEGSWGSEQTKSVFIKEVIPFIKTLRELFIDFDNGINLELYEVKMVFNQMEAAVEQYVMNIVMHSNSVSVNVLPANNKCLVNDNLKSERLIQENDHLFELLLSQDIIHICVNSLANLTNYGKIEHDYIDEYTKNLVLKVELAKMEHMVEKKVFDEVVLRCSRLKNRIFHINEWQAKLEEKDVSIAKLKKHIENLKGKNVVKKDATSNNAKVIAPGMFKLDLEPLSPKVLKNREAHIDYIKHSQEHADILREIVKHARALRPLDSDLDSACKYIQRIQEMLVYATATCPSLLKPSEKLVAVTPLNKNKKVRFAEPATSSSNTKKQVDSYKTQDSNKPVLPSTGMKSSTSASRSQPSSNTKKNRISQTTSSNQKNKVEY
ncbi:hypothetical protein Tco_1261753 [Tanacetum coccineum]